VPKAAQDPAEARRLARRALRLCWCHRQRIRVRDTASRLHTASGVPIRAPAEASVAHDNRSSIELGRLLQRNASYQRASYSLDFATSAPSSYRCREGSRRKQRLRGLCWDGDVGWRPGNPLVRSMLLRPPRFETLPKNQISIRRPALGSVADFVLAFGPRGPGAIRTRGHMTIRRVLTNPQGGTR